MRRMPPDLPPVTFTTSGHADRDARRFSSATGVPMAEIFGGGPPDTERIAPTARRDEK